ncbi:hypothetical protein [Romboutsia sp. MSSM.1001216sp_RTP31141st1_G3_RTP31141_220114]|uniref:hypothetical protein n=1 Tax=unclassified Romboutsia TaxID=2626894 RepID=UPI0031B59B73
MTIQKMISEISRNIGSLEVVHYARDINSTLKARDLLAGIYMLDEFIEIRGATGTEISIKNDKVLKHEKVSKKVYRFYNSKINILIRPIEY